MRGLARGLEREERREGRYRSLLHPAVQSRHVLHEAYLQTLLDQGLEWHDIFETSSSVEEVRRRIARELQTNGVAKISTWKIGIILGTFARAFGPKAPIDWIAKSAFHDCEKMKNSIHNVWIVGYAHGTSTRKYPGELDDVRKKLDLDLCR